MAGSKPQAYGRQHEKDAATPVMRANMQKFQDSLLLAMERMLNERLPTMKTYGSRHHSTTTSDVIIGATTLAKGVHPTNIDSHHGHRDLVDRGGQQGEGGLGCDFGPHMLFGGEIFKQDHGKEDEGPYLNWESMGDPIYDVYPEEVPSDGATEPQIPAARSMEVQLHTKNLENVILQADHSHVTQIPSEIDSHNAILRERENKIEVGDSGKCEDECYYTESMRDTQQKQRLNHAMLLDNFAETNSCTGIRSPMSHIMQDFDNYSLRKEIESRVTLLQAGEENEGLYESFKFDLDKDGGKNSNVLPMTFTQSNDQLETIVSCFHLDDKFVDSFHDLTIAFVELDTPAHMIFGSMVAAYQCFEFEIVDAYSCGNFSANIFDHVKLITLTELLSAVPYDECLCCILHGEHVKLEIFDIAKTKSNIFNQLCGLEEIFVLPSTKLFAASERENMNACQCSCPHMYYLDNYGLSAHRKALGTQKMTLSCSEVHEVVAEHCKCSSTYAPFCKDKHKVNAMIKIQTNCFHKAKLLLGLYDYRFKIAIFEEKRSWQCIYMTREGQVEGGTTRTWKKQDNFNKESRSTPFQEGEDDEDIPATHTNVNSRHINHELGKVPTCINNESGAVNNEPSYKPVQTSQEPVTPIEGPIT